MNDSAHLESLLAALDASRLALRRDECGDWRINGKCGHVYADGTGFLLCISTDESARRWTNVKQRLGGFCILRQDGDDEGCLHLDHLPTRTEARVIREALAIRKRRHLSAAAMAHAISALEQSRAALNRPLTA